MRSNFGGHVFEELGDSFARCVTGTSSRFGHEGPDRGLGNTVQRKECGDCNTRSDSRKSMSVDGTKSGSALCLS
jgi:hypothetical protein